MEQAFRDLLEAKWEEIRKADWRDAPFPYDTQEAAIYNRARRELMQWVIEMMPVEEEN